MEIFKSSLTYNDIKHFSNLRIQRECENISVCDLEVNINNLDKLRDDFKILLGDLYNMHVPESLDMKMDNKDYE